MDQVLHVTPSSVSFPPSLGLSSTSSLNLRNLVGQKLIYRLTANNIAYTADPAVGIIRPHGNVQVELTQQLGETLSHGGPPGRDGRHTYLLQILELSSIHYDTSPASLERLLKDSVGSVVEQDIHVSGIFAGLTADHESTISLGSTYSMEHRVDAGQMLNIGEGLQLPSVPDDTDAKLKSSQSVLQDLPAKAKLVATPTAITFSFSAGKTCASTQTFRNTSAHPVAFKLLTNNPDLYLVRPTMDVMPPFSYQDVQFERKASQLSDLRECRDRFIVKVCNLDSVPRSNLSGRYHGYPSLEDLWTWIPAESVQRIRIPVKLKEAA